MTHALKVAPPATPTCTRPDRQRVQALAAQMVDRKYWPRERPLAYQRARLRETVRHAVAHSPYYRRVIGDVGNGE